MCGCLYSQITAKQPGVISVEWLLVLLLVSLLLLLGPAQIVGGVLRAGEAELGYVVEISVRGHDSSSLLGNKVATA